MKLVVEKIIEILRIFPEMGAIKIADDNHASLVTSDGRKTLEINENLSASGISLKEKLTQNISPLKDDFVPDAQLKYLIGELVSKGLFQRLNHLGIGYRVDSIEKEKEYLISQIQGTGLHLYEEEAIAGSAWLFVGDRSNWQDPLAELVLVEHTSDKWSEYWLPHFQIDIDTYLNGDEIESMIKEAFQGKVKPFRMIESEEFVMLVRSRLGIISGINIFLDMGFEGRMTRYHRTRLLTELA